MSLGSIYDIAGSGMTAQSLRMNTTASNIANAQAVSGSAESAYKAKHPIFKAVMQQTEQQMGGRLGNDSQSSGAAVQVVGIHESSREPVPQYQPGHPMADENGYVYMPNVNVVEEMTNMISASRAFQINVEVMSAAKTMSQRVLSLGK